MEANKIETRTLIISLATIISTEVAAKIAISRGLYCPMVVLGVARLLEIIMIILIAVIWGKGMSSIGLARLTILPGLKKGMIWSVGFGMVASLVFAALFAAGINAFSLMQTHLPPKHGEIALFFLVGGIAGPTAEEFFFRGILYGFLRRWGMVVAVVLSTLIFVLSHPINHGLPVTQAVGGITFAVAYEVEGSLMAPITIHVLANVAIFTVSLIF